MTTQLLATTSECQDLQDEVQTLQQELSTLLRDLTAWEKRLRTVNEGGPVAFRTHLADELHEILHPRH